MNGGDNNYLSNQPSHWEKTSPKADKGKTSKSNISEKKGRLQAYRVQPQQKDDAVKIPKPPPLPDESTPELRGTKAETLSPEQKEAQSKAIERIKKHERCFGCLSKGSFA